MLVAIKNKLFSLQALDNLPEFFKQLSQHVQTDIDLAIAQFLAPALARTKDFKTVSIILNTDNVLSNSKSSSGQFILIPKTGENNWSQIQEYINQQLTN